MPKGFKPDMAAGSVQETGARPHPPAWGGISAI